MNDVLSELSNVTISKVHVQDSDSIIEINAKMGCYFSLPYSTPTPTYSRIPAYVFTSKSVGAINPTLD